MKELSLHGKMTRSHLVIGTKQILCASLALSLILGSINLLMLGISQESKFSTNTKLKDYSFGLLTNKATHTSKRREHNFTVGVCLIAKDEDAYLTEWIDYQLLALEFDAIYIFDNAQTFQLQAWYNNTRDHPIYKRVLVIHKPGYGFIQKEAYRECMKRFGKLSPDSTQNSTHYQVGGIIHKRHDYMAMLDVDEFIVLKQHESIQKIPSNKPVTRIHDLINDVWIEPVGGRGALVLNWILVGHSNKTVYQPIPVLKRFQYRDPYPENVIKPIVHCPDFVDMLNPHGVLLKNLASAAGVTIWNMNSQVAHMSNTKASLKVAHLSEIPAEKALIYHVRYTSMREYTIKRCIRRQASGNLKGCDWSDKHNPKLYMTPQEDPAPIAVHNYPRVGTVFDDSPWRFFTAKVPKYRIFDSSDWEDFSTENPHSPAPVL